MAQPMPLRSARLRKQVRDALNVWGRVDARRKEPAVAAAVEAEAAKGQFTPNQAFLVDRTIYPIAASCGGCIFWVPPETRSTEPSPGGSGPRSGATSSTTPSTGFPTETY